MGDVLTLVISLSIMAFGYGRLSRDVEALSTAMGELQRRDITPGARSQIAAIAVQDAAMQQQINDLRAELREQRREVIASLDRLEAKLDK
jgi:predicted  nucleic acid-binding Zn-ribbon protein